MAGRSHQTWLRFWEVVLALSLTVSMAGATERLCGKQLADALDLVCYGRGFYWSDKRSASGSVGITRRDGGSQTDVRARRPQELGRPRAGRGVVVECCLNACSYEVLESYCAEPGDAPPSGLLSFWGPNGNSVQQGAPGAANSAQTGNGGNTAVQGDPEMAKSGRHNRHYFFVHLSPRPTRSPLA